MVMVVMIVMMMMRMMMMTTNNDYDNGHDKTTLSINELSSC